MLHFRKQSLSPALPDTAMKKTGFSVVKSVTVTTFFLQNPAAFIKILLLSGKKRPSGAIAGPGPSLLQGYIRYQDEEIASQSFQRDAFHEPGGPFLGFCMRPEIFQQPGD